MFPTVVAWAFAFLLFAATARSHDGWDVFEAFPDCWEECLGDTSNGCDDSDCICSASQSNSYLPVAVECMATSCGSSEATIDSVFIGPIRAWCLSIDETIPDSVISSAYDAAGATATATFEPEPTMTRTSEHDASSESHKTHSKTSSAVKTATTTSDDDTSTTDSPTSAATVRSSAAESSSAASSQAQQQPQAGATTTGSQPAQETSDEHGGSPFDITAGASHWSAPVVLGGIGAAIGILMRI